MDKKIEVSKVIIHSNIFDVKDEIISNKIKAFLSSVEYNTIEKEHELDTLYGCKLYYNLEVFYDIKSNDFRKIKLEADLVTFLRVHNFFFQKYNIRAIQMFE
jgi:hypothetical protein